MDKYGLTYLKKYAIITVNQIEQDESLMAAVVRLKDIRCRCTGM